MTYETTNYGIDFEVHFESGGGTYDEAPWCNWEIESASWNDYDEWEASFGDIEAANKIALARGIVTPYDEDGEPIEGFIAPTGKLSDAELAIVCGLLSEDDQFELCREAAE